jgi:hypothetical protein
MAVNDDRNDTPVPNGEDGPDVTEATADSDPEPESSSVSEPPGSDPRSPPFGDADREDADDPDVEESTESDDRRLQGAPTWVAGLTLLGLVLLYLGERILGEAPTGHWLASGAGIFALLASTVLRFSPRFRGEGEMVAINRLLAVLTLVTAGAVLLYFGTGEWGSERLGLTALEPDTRDRVESLLTIAWVVLLVGSCVPMVFAEAAMYPMRHAERPEVRRVRAAVVAGLALVLAAIYGSLFVFAARSAEVKVDYSYFKTSRPSESTRNIAASLEQPVTVYAFFPPVNEARVEVERYLRDLASGTENLKVEVHDRVLVPKLAREVRVRQDGVIVLKRDKVTQQLSIGTKVKDARPKLRKLDRSFQQRLMKFVRSQRTAYLTTGHGELNDKSSRRPGGADKGKDVRELLRVLNYRTKSLGLSQGLAREVPKDADLVLVLGPSDPFLPDEVAALKRYAEGGGKLFLALDPNVESSASLLDEPGQRPDETSRGGHDAAAAPGASAAPADSGAAPTPSAGEPAADASRPRKPGQGSAKDESAKDGAAPTPGDRGLGALAEAVGLEFDATLLANARYHLSDRFNSSDRILLGTNRYSSHASVSTLSRYSQEAVIVLPGAGSLRAKKGTSYKVDFTVRSMPGTFADTNGNYEFDKGQERKETYNFAAAVSVTPKPGAKSAKTEKKANPPKSGEAKDVPGPEEMRAFVLTDASGLESPLLRRLKANQLLFADAVKWLGGEESFAGQVNTEEDVRIEHTRQEDLVWFYSTIFGFPALVLGGGLLLARRGRRRKRSKKPATAKQGGET